jgi:hypothetical protein
MNFKRLRWVVFLPEHGMAVSDANVAYDEQACRDGAHPLEPSIARV